MPDSLHLQLQIHTSLFSPLVCPRGWLLETSMVSLPLAICFSAVRDTSRISGSGERKQGVCSRQNHCPPKCPCLNLQPLAKRILQMWLKISRWGDYLGVCNVITRVLERWKKEVKGRNKIIDVAMGAEVRVMPLLEGAMSQGMWEGFRSQRKQGSDFPLESPGATQSHQHFDFRPVKHISRLWTPEL